MKKLLPLAIFLALPAMASAANERCEVSFAGAQYNICDGNATQLGVNLASLSSLSAVQDSSLRLVKFEGPIEADQRTAVEAAGARILGYAPHYAYIVRMAPGQDADMRRIPGVIWAGPFLPALKLDPNISAELRQGGLVDRLGIQTLEVSLDSDAPKNQLQVVLSSVAGLTNAQVNDVGGHLRLTAGFERGQLSQTIEQLALRDDVLAIGFRKAARLNNSQGHWLHQSNVNTPQPQMPVWSQGLYGCGQIIGELDTGLWMDHVSFKDASQPLPISKCNTGVTCPPIAAPNYNARKVIAYYKWSDLAGSSWGDNHGHGTHVAGSIIGNDNVANPGTDCVNFTTPGGDTNLDGMAPGAKLVMQESGGNLAYLNTHGGTPYHAADIAYQNGARIHSNSWGGGCTDQFGACVSGCSIPYDQQAQDADQVMRDRSDLLMVFAAGNDATACSNGNNVGSPGNAKNVLTIGATSRGTSGNNMASFSSRGPTLDSRTKPDLGAQGSGIISASRSNNGTLSMSGTSMATPTASGLAALVRDYLARGYYPNGVATPANAITTPSGALIKAILAAGAFKMTGSGAGTNPSQSQGFGRILLDDSLYFDSDARRLYLQDEAGGLQTGSEASYSLNVNAGQVFTVVLTWSDVAGAVNASPATVNSLRLEVEAPNGDVWTQKLPAGYNVNNATPTQSTATTNYDDINTLHRLRFDTPEAGAWSIRVRGINVPNGPQSFALAATGDFSTGPTFSVGGNVSGTNAAGLKLRLNNGADFAVNANGPYVFPSQRPDGSAYQVTVSATPYAQECSVSNPSGVIAGANVSNVDISCASVPTWTVGGTVAGLTGSGLVLELNGGNNLPINADGAFTFAQGLVNNANYTVTIGTQPLGQTCSVAQGTGTIASAAVNNVLVNCVDLPPQAFPIGGTVSGMTAPGLILQLNGGLTLTRNNNGSYAFTPGVTNGSTYEVTVLTSPAGQVCTVANASGTVGFGPVTNANVSCAMQGPAIFADGFEVSP